MPKLNYLAAKDLSLYNVASRLLYFSISTSGLRVYELCTKIIYETIRWSFYLASRQKEAEIISEILLKAASEPEFRDVLIRDPALVLEQFNVSPEAKLIIRRSITDLTQ